MRASWSWAGSPGTCSDWHGGWTDLGYRVTAGTYFLSDFGLPQRRERAIVVATRRPLPARDLRALWDGWQVDAKATHVRRAIWDLPPVAGRARAPG